jgi:MFS family permease
VVKPKFFARRIKKASELLPKAKIKEIIKNSFTFGFKNRKEKLNFCEVLFLILLVSEKKEVGPSTKTSQKFSFSWKFLNPKVKLFLLISFIFALGNSSDAFLILRAKNLGLTTQLAVSAYVLYNLIQTLLGTYLGKLSDKIGHRKMFAFGLLIFSFVYFSFGVIKDSLFLWFLFPIYGIYIAATDGVSKAYLGEFISEKEAGSVYGLYQMLLALASFFASFVGGILWTKIGPQATFYFGAIMAFISFSILSFFKFWKKI